MLIDISVRNWDRYNPKKSAFRYTWFRFDNDFCNDDDFADFDAEERLVWIYILCQCSKKQRTDVKIRPDQIDKKLGIKPKKVLASVQKMAAYGMLTHLGSEETDLDLTCFPGHSLDSTYIHTNIQTNKQEPKGSLSSGDDHPLVKAWNEHCGDLPKVQRVNPARLQKIKARWKDCDTIEQWVGVIKKIAASPWHTGQNDRGWKANFDFLLKPDTFHKALEGAYDNRTSKPQQDWVDDYEWVGSKPDPRGVG